MSVSVSQRAGIVVMNNGLGMEGEEEEGAEEKEHKERENGEEDDGKIEDYG